MIIEEILPDNPDLVRRYSDKGVYIHGGCPEGNYEEAIDLITMNRIYEETSILIEPAQIFENDPKEMKEALQILLNIN